MERKMEIFTGIRSYLAPDIGKAPKAYVAQFAKHFSVPCFVLRLIRNMMAW